MIKSFLILTSFTILLYSSQQVVLVVADDINSSKAKLQCFENDKKVSTTIHVNIGTNGLGWGLGELNLTHIFSYPHKKEGDKRAPIGVFKLTNIFGYSKKSNFKLPYLYASKKLICVDDSGSNFYNQIIQKNGNEKSFEYMRRNDNQYKIGVVIAHNKAGNKGDGSCIFLHVQKDENASTAGCTSMKLADLKMITHWLDKDKSPILVQIPKSLSSEVLKLYPELKNSELLH
jgi:L,D-peptidoglycan transpeptidase YkuD (ErfK/YbiS/YcfS/YnhG family)